MGTGADDKVLLLTWRCSSASCYAWSWPCRSRCHRCGSAKPLNPPRREDWWLQARLPPWAADEAPSPHDAPAHHVPPGGGSRRIPGLPTQADLRRPTAKGTGKGIAASATPAAAPAAATVHSGAGHDPRLTAPGALDPPTPNAPGHEVNDEDDDDDHEQPSWAKVVRRGRKAGKSQDDDRAPHGTPAAPPHDDAAPPPDPKTPVLPPPLTVERPRAPRRTIVSRRQAQLDRIERLEADGASPAKIRRAQEGLQELERELRLAGGATERALSFTIKSGDDTVEKTRRALAKAREDKQARLELRDSIDKALEEDDIRIERLEQRHQAALERRLYHVESKRAECVPERTIDEYRSAIAQIAAATEANPALAAVQSLLQRELDVMAPPQVDFGIAEGDTPSDTDMESDDDLDHPPHSPSADAHPANITASSNDKYAEQLDDARKRLEKITAERRAAILNAEAHASRAAKRRLGADAEKSQEADGDDPMAAGLTVERVKELYQGRLADAAEEVDHLARMAAREEVPVMPAGSTTSRRPTSPPAQPTTTRRSRPPSPQRTPCPQKSTPQAFVELSRGADERMQEIHDKVVTERREEARLDRINFQERMQRQQEIEQIQAELTERRLAAARAAAEAAGAEIEAALDARLRAERAPTPVADPRPGGIASGGRAIGARWGQPQSQATRGRHPAGARGRSEDGAIASAARRSLDGDGPAARERSPRLRQSDMATS